MNFIKSKSKLIVILIFIILIFGISSSFANTDVDNTISVANDIDTVSSSNEDITVIKQENIQEDKVLTRENINNETLKSSSESNEVLNANPDGTFSDLASKINSGSGTITLDRNYVYTASKDSNYVNGITIDKTITIDGKGFTLNGNNAASIFQITGENVVLNNIKFINGYKEGNGGAIHWSGLKGTLKNSEFKNDHANNEGGAIYWTGLNGTLDNCNFYDCSHYSNSRGGAICWRGGDYGIINNTNFYNCTANKGYEGDAGSIAFQSNYGVINNCYFKDSKCGDYGSAVSSDNHHINITNCIFENCYAEGSDDGGAIGINGNDNNIKNCTFINCSGNNIHAPGAINIYGGSNNTIEECTFIGNSARLSSGAVRIRGSNNTLNSCIFINNHAETNGGAVLIEMENNFINSCTFINNTANNGGAIYSVSSINVNSCVFINNTAKNGGDVYNTGSNTNVTNSSFFNYGSNTIFSESENIKIDGIKYGKLYVSKNGNGDGLTENNPTSWVKAYDSIAENGQIILLEGEYTNIINQDIDKSIIITGKGNVIINANNNGRIFTINANNVTIEDISLKNGVFERDNGGAIYWKGNYGTIKNAVLTDNHAYWGGAIYVYGNYAQIINCIFNDNTLIYDTGNPRGGALFIAGSNSIVNNSKFYRNKALTGDGDGGAIGYGGDYANLTNCYFEDNSCRDAGGAVVYTMTNPGIIINCTFVNSNSNGSDNGAALCIDVVNDGLEIINCTFINSTTSNAYGAALELYTPAHVKGCEFINNQGIYGGAISIHAGVKRDYSASIEDCTFINNTAVYGGAVFNSIANTIIENCEFINNSATNSGGAISNTVNGLSINNVSFVGNNAPNEKDISSTEKIIISSSTFNAKLNVHINKTYYYGQNVIISGNLTASASDVTIALYQNNIKLTDVTVNNNQFTYTWVKPAAGNYTLTLATKDSAGNTYVYDYTPVKFEVKKHTVNNLIVTINDYKVKDQITINVDTGLTDTTGNVVVLLNGKDETITLTNGKGSKTINPLPANKYDWTATYSGDNKYNKAVTSGSFRVTKYTTTTTLQISNTYVGKNVIVKATVTSTASFKVNGTIKIAGTQGNYQITITNGEGQTTIQNLPAGRYTVSSRH